MPLTVRVLHVGTPAARGYAAALLFAASKEEESKLEVLAAAVYPPYCLYSRREPCGPRRTLPLRSTLSPPAGGVPGRSLA